MVIHRSLPTLARDILDIVCLSDVGWNLDVQRSLYLCHHCFEGGRVFFIEKPTFHQEKLGRLDVSQDPSGVMVVVPHLPQHLTEDVANADLQLLIDDLLIEYQVCKYICWYYTAVAIAFTRHLQPQTIIYDRRNDCPVFPEASPQLKDYEAELFHSADLVLTTENSLDASHPNVHVFPDSSAAEYTWSAMSKLINSTITTPHQPEKIDSKAGIPSFFTKDFVFDYLIVGAGFSGSVIAERLATQSGKQVLLVDRRNHIGGNAYDHYDDHGILVHKYGPHIFHTNSRAVFEYLSQFTQWRAYEHRVLASVDGQLVPIPINLDTINQLYGMNLNSFQAAEFLESIAEPQAYIRTSEDVVLSKVGKELYEKFFRGYTKKQWGLDPSELDKSVIARIPTRTNRDNRYFSDTYQAMPLHGFTRMFENMLAHPHIKVMLNTDYREIAQAIPYREMIYTGPVDEFFGDRYGKLPYRSLDFKHETHNTPVFQPAPVINYPNEHLYTRVTEFKYLTGQEHAKTSIVYEFPKGEGDPYYPIPRPENHEIYQKYHALADATPGVYFVGRLATYKYLNMDQCVAQALSVYKQIAVSSKL
ncbi:MAG: UDP-galactopyranose mutase [Goleter apudmare HA4340-LM2]|jgi:UDP-galactopyranose mutase|nr:UDP-galactopyranose mutase [Goleter apudmare HA4340-LM2]